MSSDFPKVALCDLINHQKGFPFNSQDYVDAGVPVVRVSNFTHDSISIEGIKFVDDSIAQQNAKVKLKEDDIIIATVGSWPNNPLSIVGKTVRVPKRLAGSLMNQNSVILRSKSCEKIDQKFLFFALKTKAFSNYLVSNAQGSANQASITLTDIFAYEIEWPTHEIRKYIVAVIDSFSKKIEINRQTNQTLEQIAQAMFKSWFVDFEPTRAKLAAKEAGASVVEIERAAMCAISGKTPAQLAQLPPEIQQQLKTTAALFPDALVDSELGEMPVEWEVKSLAGIAQYANAKIEVSKLNGNNYISTENMLENRGGVGAATALPSGSTVPSFSPNHILISNIRPYFKKIWLARFDGGRSNDVLSFVAKEKGCEEFLYNLLYQDEFFEFMTRTSKGAKMPRGDKDAIAGWKFVCASRTTRLRFSEIVKTFYSIIESLNAENINLSNARDNLLPKLLSGEIQLQSGP